MYLIIFLEDLLKNSLQNQPHCRPLFIHTKILSLIMNLYIFQTLLHTITHLNLFNTRKNIHYQNKFKLDVPQYRLTKVGLSRVVESIFASQLRQLTNHHIKNFGNLTHGFVCLSIFQYSCWSSPYKPQP